MVRQFADPLFVSFDSLAFYIMTANRVAVTRRTKDVDSQVKYTLLLVVLMLSILFFHKKKLY